MHDSRLQSRNASHLQLLFPWQLHWRCWLTMHSAAKAPSEARSSGLRWGSLAPTRGNECSILKACSTSCSDWIHPIIPVSHSKNAATKKLNKLTLQESKGNTSTSFTLCCSSERICRSPFPKKGELQWSHYNELAHSLSSLWLSQKLPSRPWLSLQKKQGRNRGIAPSSPCPLGTVCEKPQEALGTLTSLTHS